MVKDLKKNTPEATTFGSIDTSWSMIFRCRPRYLYQSGGTKSGAKISGTHEGVLCACVCVSVCTYDRAGDLNNPFLNIHVHNDMQVDAALCAD